MDEMQAIEQRITRELLRRAGPSQPVDDAAIFTAITATQSPTWRFQSMFSAAKFVVAGAIVALFGGFLLAGVLTQQPSDEPLPAVGASAPATTQAEPTDASTSEPEPTTEGEAVDSTSSDLLPGVDLVTEEVAPGVYRILSDGAGHLLVTEPPGALVFAPDGDIVAFSGSERRLDRFYTLGSPGEQATPDGYVGDETRIGAVIDDDGNLIAKLMEEESGSQTGALHDGDAWTRLTWPDGTANVEAVDVGPDGAVWVTRESTGSLPQVARIQDGVWSVLPMLDDGTRTRYNPGVAIAPGGTVWFATNSGPEPQSEDMKGLLQFDGEAWLEPVLPIEAGLKRFGPLAIGPDGTLWVYVVDGARGRGPHALLRMRDGEWSVFTEADGLPRLIGTHTYGSGLAVDGQGTLWIAFVDDHTTVDLPPPFGPSDGPHGILSFDGSAWTQYLKGHLVRRLYVASDGSVWATTERDCWSAASNVGPDRCVEEAEGLYVITPEAVAATE